MRAALGVVLVVCFAAVAPAAAQEHADPARLYFEAGRSHFETGDFAQAASDFQRAYDMSGRPELLYNLYLAHRNAGHLREATEALQRYLQDAPEVPQRADLEARLQQMQRDLSGQDEARPPARSPVPWIVLGAGGGVMLAGTITGILAVRARSQLEQDYNCIADLCDSGFEADRRRGRRLALATDVLLFGGLATAALGVVLALVLKPGDREEAPPVALSCGPDGCAASLTVDL